MQPPRCCSHAGHTILHLSVQGILCVALLGATSPTPMCGRGVAHTQPAGACLALIYYCFRPGRTVAWRRHLRPHGSTNTSPAGYWTLAAGPLQRAPPTCVYARTCPAGPRLLCDGHGQYTARVHPWHGMAWHGYCQRVCRWDSHPCNQFSNGPPRHACMYGNWPCRGLAHAAERTYTDVIPPRHASPATNAALTAHVSLKRQVAARQSGWDRAGAPPPPSHAMQNEPPHLSIR